MAAKRDGTVKPLTKDYQCLKSSALMAAYELDFDASMMFIVIDRKKYRVENILYSF